MTTYAVALGSNLGDRLGHLRGAVEALDDLGGVTAVSGLYETAPLGGPPQDTFLNAVVVVETDLAPAGLLEALQAIEAAHDRRREERWGARTLDLDIVAMDPGSVEEANLVIPHPRAEERRFVLAPLCDVWPEALVATGTTARDALQRVSDQQAERLARIWAQGPFRLGRYWVAAQAVLFAAILLEWVWHGSLPSLESGPVVWIGLAVALVGAVLTTLSARARGGALTALPEPLPEATLTERGPYAHARHPIYGGLILVFMGMSLLLGSWLGFGLSFGLLALFWAKSGYEERQLRIAYPDYHAYRKRVGKRLIPYLL